MNRTTILVGDAITRLKELPDASVQCAITSPPYWGKRTYHLQEWVGGDVNCEHEGKTEGEYKTSYKRPSRSATPQHPVCIHCGAEQQPVKGAIGLETTFKEHVENLLAVFEEVKRVLRDDGVLWLNYGDGYAGSWGNYHATGRGTQRAKNTERYERKGFADPSFRPPASRPGSGFRAKNLMMMPARIALAMVDAGWECRSEVIWAKTNGMSESVKDRPVNTHEKIYLFAKQRRYYYDHVAVKAPKRSVDGKLRYEAGSNLRNVWEIPVAQYKGPHHAVMPERIAETCILAGSSAVGGCSECGAPYKREMKYPQPPKKLLNLKDGGRKLHDWREEHPPWTVGWEPSCTCDAVKSPQTILDPFGGVGTVGLVANLLHRDAILCEITPYYAQLAKQRIEEDFPMLEKIHVELDVPNGN